MYAINMQIRKILGRAAGSPHQQHLEHAFLFPAGHELVGRPKGQIGHGVVFRAPFHFDAQEELIFVLLLPFITIVAAGKA